MSDTQKPSPETVARAARELVGTPLDEGQTDAVAALLAGLIAEMGPMRAMDVGPSEPATLYDASEPAP